eukprot:TRINITY_DN30901_c0_g1_i1.p1 TRINITY_DN30901_c0_g1~~TRINITY_DN30901_c0_g1_i1.p1  ORF type:complete len:282 (-),score=47.22 TRINITY_DN30901_c0_g1_i1:294-1139(-)
MQGMAAGACVASAIIVVPSKWLPAELKADVVEDDGDYHVCLVTRASDKGYLPGCTTFPGGPLHSMDTALANDQWELQTQLDYENLALRMAAIRETFRQTGIVLLRPEPNQVLRDATRPILDREGPRAFLDCMIAWHRGNPNPELSFGAMDELARFAVHASTQEDGQPLRMHYFMTKIPTAEEVKMSSPLFQDAAEIIWAKPSEALSWHEHGELQLAPFERDILKGLSTHAPTLALLRNHSPATAGCGPLLGAQHLDPLGFGIKEAYNCNVFVDKTELVAKL